MASRRSPVRARLAPLGGTDTNRRRKPIRADDPAGVGKIRPMPSATWQEVRARRLARSALAERAGVDRLVEIARDLGGVHAQVQASAELQLAVRVDGITQADVRDALWERRALVKAWTLRGTLHLHPANELALWYAA